VAAALTGLRPGATYYYRLDVQYGPSTYSGTVLSFTTPAVPAVVTIGVASAVSDTAATLAGTVDPNGFATTYYFQYGPTTAYGQSSAPLSAGTGTSAQAVSAAIGGLSAATGYHYRLVATSAGGTVYSNDLTFATLPPPPPAPVLRFTIRTRQTLATALRRGIKIGFGCNVACTVSFAARQAPRSAVDIARVPVTIASGGAEVRHRGRGTATLKLTRPGRRKLERASKLALVIDGVATNASGVAGRPLTHRLTLR
jgi:hypothetical protein